ncbi:hypothetical protein HDU87_004253 [Geranomyces variabilis]|uniref:Uncharacterized protein n=1 Tax=Geranomyces variabilis TaxID=109894 RepID=A0AAD5TJV8_9FUNG|nr:hypothetical protein HDU87_004253 [Geranomyces variabilis]
MIVSLPTAPPVASLHDSSTSSPLSTATLAFLWFSISILLMLVRVLIVRSTQSCEHQAPPDSALPEVQAEVELSPIPLASSPDDSVVALSTQSEDEVRLLEEEAPQPSAQFKPDPEAALALQKARISLQRAMVGLEMVCPSPPTDDELCICPVKATASFCEVDPNDEKMFPLRDSAKRSPLAPKVFNRFSMCLDILDNRRRNGEPSCFYWSSLANQGRPAGSVSFSMARERATTEHVGNDLEDPDTDSSTDVVLAPQQKSGGWAKDSTGKWMKCV